MSIDSVLKKEGIENIIAIDTLTVNRIANNISEKLSETFREHNLDESEIFASICRLKMYFAKMPDDQSGAKYFSRNNAIYFNEKFNIEDLEESALHECIHYLQEVKDEKGNLVRLGLYNFQDNQGEAINEAAVQLMTEEACGKEEDKVKYYDLFLATISPDYYPLECVLLNEMVYFTGKYPLYHSTLHSDDVFKNTFCGKYGEKVYKNIEKNINQILDMEMILNAEKAQLQYINNEKKARQINEASEKRKEKIANLFLKTQDYIMENCFNAEFNNVRNMEDLMYFKEKIYHFKDIIGYTAEYKNYNDFYVQKMKEFEIKKEKIENGELVYNEVNRLELVNTQTKGYSFIRKILIKLGLLRELNSSAKHVKEK